MSSSTSVSASSSHFLPAVVDEEQWASLCAATTQTHVARTEGVKVIVQWSNEEVPLPPRIFFLNTTQYPMHYDFASRFLRERMGAREFAESMYTGKDRHLVLFSIVRFVHVPAWTIELSFADTLVQGAAEVVEAMDHVRQRCFFRKDLRFLPTNQAQIAAYENACELAGARNPIPLLPPSQLFGDTKFQPFTLGSVCGTVRTAADADQATLSQFGLTDIVVVPKVPNDIQAVGALVTGEMQTPLCHVALLCANRNTPNMMLKGERLQHLTEHAGSRVFLSVAQDDFSVHALPPGQEGERIASWCHSRTQVALPDSSPIS